MKRVSAALLALFLAFVCAAPAAGEERLPGLSRAGEGGFVVEAARKLPACRYGTVRLRDGTCCPANGVSPSGGCVTAGVMTPILPPSPPACPGNRARDAFGRCPAPAACPGGGQPDRTDGCPTIFCPDGLPPDAFGRCNRPACPGGESRNGFGECPSRLCPDGSPRTSAGQCPVAPPCSGGAPRDAGGNCPLPPACPSGFAPIGGYCRPLLKPGGTPHLTPPRPTSPPTSPTLHVAPPRSQAPIAPHAPRPAPAHIAPTGSTLHVAPPRPHGPTTPRAPRPAPPHRAGRVDPSRRPASAAWPTTPRPPRPAPAHIAPRPSLLRRRCCILVPRRRGRPPPNAGRPGRSRRPASAAWADNPAAAEAGPRPHRAGRAVPSCRAADAASSDSPDGAEAGARPHRADRARSPGDEARFPCYWDAPNSGRRRRRRPDIDPGDDFRVDRRPAPSRAWRRQREKRLPMIPIGVVTVSDRASRRRLRGQGRPRHRGRADGDPRDAVARRSGGSFPTSARRSRRR